MEIRSFESEDSKEAIAYRKTRKRLNQLYFGDQPPGGIYLMLYILSPIMGPFYFLYKKINSLIIELILKKHRKRFERQGIIKNEEVLETETAKDTLSVIIIEQK